MPSGKNKNISVDIIIPTYKPGAEFAKLLRSLALQVLPANRIIIVNTEEEYWDKSFESICPNTTVIHIKKSEFDHGASRHMAASKSQADIMVFMTQDAVPADDEFIGNLVAPIASKSAELSYARQLPKADAGLIEQFTRGFNYPKDSRIKSIRDIDELGIKTFFVRMYVQHMIKGYMMSLEVFRGRLFSMRICLSHQMRYLQATGFRIRQRQGYIIRMNTAPKCSLEEILI